MSDNGANDYLFDTTGQEESHEPETRCNCETCLEYLRKEKQEADSRAEALAEYPAHKEQQEQAECPHDEHDHGICLECGADIFDDLVGRAELLRDE